MNKKVALRIFVSLFILIGVTFPKISFAAGTVDIKVNNSDSVLSFSGKKKVVVSWTGVGVKNCDVYVARGKSFKVKLEGSKKITVPSDAPYISYNCNDAISGAAVSDYVYITDPKGTSSLSVITNDTQTVTAIASGKSPSPVCAGGFFGTIKWGDKQSDPVAPESKNSNCTTDLSDSQTHYYGKPGKYTITFTDWAGRKHSEKITISLNK